MKNKADKLPLAETLCPISESGGSPEPLPAWKRRWKLGCLLCCVYLHVCSALMVWTAPRVFSGSVSLEMKTVFREFMTAACPLYWLLLAVTFIAGYLLNSELAAACLAFSLSAIPLIGWLLASRGKKDGAILAGVFLSLVLVFNTLFLTLSVPDKIDHGQALFLLYGLSSIMIPALTLAAFLCWKLPSRRWISEDVEV